MPAPSAPPQVSLHHDFADTDDDYGLEFDPATFETAKYSRPGTSGTGKQSPDSPTLGAAQPATALPLYEYDLNGRPTKLVGEMQAPTTTTESTPGIALSTPHSYDEPIASSSSSPPRNTVGHIVNPATIPIRTSSSNAVANGEKNNSSSSPKKSPRKHRSLGAVPEEEKRYSVRPEPHERDWLAQNRHTYTGGNMNTTNNNINGGLPSQTRRTLHSPAPTSFSQQPTLHASPSQRTTNAHAAGPSVSSSSTSDPLAADHLILGSPSASWSAEKENILKAPFDYLESHPGKDIRSSMILAFNAWLSVPETSLTIITNSVSMLHTASLLVDDVEDSSNLRRGVPVAHSIFGTAQTINSANYVYFLALQELLKLENPEAVRIYTDELLNLHRGQGMDLFWRDTLTCPSEDDYLEMVGNKTGGLFRLAIKLMCAESPLHNFRPSSRDGGEGQTDYVPLVNTLGLLFQILDDYRNLASSTYTTNKGLCEDLTEGKFSFPIIHAIRSDPSNLVLINILKQKTRDDDVKRYALAYMEKAGSFSYTRRVLRGLTRKALGLVGEVDGGRGRGEGVREILEKMRVERHGREGSSRSA